MEIMKKIVLIDSILLSSVLLNYSDNGTTNDFKPTGFK